MRELLGPVLVLAHPCQCDWSGGLFFWIHAELRAALTHSSVSTCPADQGVIPWGIGEKKKSAGFVQVYESRRKDRYPIGKHTHKKKGQHVCMGSRIFSHHAALSSLLMTVLWGGKGTAAHLLSLTAGGGFVRACGEQMNRSQEHGLVCGKRRERIKTLNLRTANNFNPMFSTVLRIKIIIITLPLSHPTTAK